MTRDSDRQGNSLAPAWVRASISEMVDWDWDLVVLIDEPKRIWDIPISWASNDLMDKCQRLKVKERGDILPETNIQHATGLP